MREPTLRTLGKTFPIMTKETHPWISQKKKKRKKEKDKNNEQLLIIKISQIEAL